MKELNTAVQQREEVKWKQESPSKDLDTLQHIVVKLEDLESGVEQLQIQTAAAFSNPVNPKPALPSEEMLLFTKEVEFTTGQKSIELNITVNTSNLENT